MTLDEIAGHTGTKVAGTLFLLLLAGTAHLRSPEEVNLSAYARTDVVNLRLTEIERRLTRFEEDIKQTRADRETTMRLAALAESLRDQLDLLIRYDSRKLGERSTTK